MNFIPPKKLSQSELLASQFLERAKEFNATVELIKVLKSRTYRIGQANVLVRASSDGNRRYFFGINYITVEEVANLDNPFVAFICGSSDKVVIIPAKILFKHLPEISHDRNGEYKINIDKNLNIVLAGRKNRIDCSGFINNWNLLLAPPIVKDEAKNTVEESLHSVLQGRQIDVVWFKPKGSNFIPEYAFEVELSTGVWSGVGRLATLIDYSNVGLYVIANDAKKFKQVISSFHEIANRYKFLANDLLGDLYSAELNLKDLRVEIGL